MSKQIILAIEPDPTQGLLLRLLAEKNDIAFVLAKSCLEAVSALEVAEDLDVLVFVDCLVPGDLDGLQCSMLLRTVDEKRQRYTPQIAITGEDGQACLSGGFDDYLQKPINANRFREVLYRWTGREARQAS